MTHHITDEQIAKLACEVGFSPALVVTDGGAFGRLVRTAIALAAPQGEPVAWMWQHDETGRKGFVDAEQLAMGWEANNPRLKITAPLYTAPAPAVSSDVLREMREFGKARMAEFMGAHHMALVLSQKINEWADKLTAAPTPTAPEVERQQLRNAQAAAVMPLIGPLLDTWVGTDRAVMSEAPELSKQLRAINNAMESAEAAAPTPPAQTAKPELPIELADVSRQIEEGKGFWHSCTGCHELNDGAPTGPFSNVFQCHLGMGCSECGGLGAIWDDTDYDGMAAFMASADSQQGQPAASSLQPVCRYISEVLAGDAASGEKNIARTIMHLLPLEQAALGTHPQPAVPEDVARIKSALTVALDALDEIALAGMSGTGQESEEAIRDWHARRAWEFIRISARARDAARKAAKGGE